MSFYSVLEIPADASQGDIRIAFRKRVMATHPDKGGTKESFNAVMRAFELLSDDKKRLHYDERLAAGRKRQPKPSQPSWEETQAFHFKGYGMECEQNAKYTSFKPPAGHHGPKNVGQNASDTGCATRGQRKRRRIHDWYCERLMKLLRIISAPRRRDVLQGLTMYEKVKLEAFASMPRPVPQSSPQKCSENALSKNTGNNTVDDDLLSDTTLASRVALGDLEQHEDTGSSNEDTDATANADGNEGEVLCRRAICEGDNLPKITKKNSARQRNQSHRGLATSATGWYSANFGVGILHVESRKVRDLSVAIEHMVALAVIKRLLCDVPANKVGDSIASAVHQGLEECAMKPEEICVKYHIRIRKRFFTSRLLMTPRTSNTADIAKWWKAVFPHNGRASVRATSLMSGVGIAEMDRQWWLCKEAFIAICSEAGRCKYLTAREIQKGEEANWYHRQRQIEQWNGWAMLREDRSARRWVLVERQRAHRERKLMGANDRLEHGCISASLGEQMRRKEEIAILKIAPVLNKWRCLQKRENGRDSRQQQEHERRKNMQERRERFGDRRRRDRAWRAMNRRDLTWAQIRERQWIPKEAN